MTQNTSIIWGIVKDDDGNPISGARVSFTDGPVPLQDIAALTDADGTFALSASVPGEYTIEVISDESVIKTEKIAVESNQEKHIEVHLSRQ